VEQIGGRLIDTAGRALQLIDRLIYGQHSNGAGGLGQVASFVHLMPVFWFPVSNFAGCTVPIVGAEFTNSGYVTGNYSLTNGLLGGATRFINTNWSNGSAASQNEIALWFWSNDTIAALGTLRVMGQSNAAATNSIEIGISPANTTRSRIHSTAGTGITSTISASDRFYYGYRDSATTQGLFVNTTKTTGVAANADAGARVLYLGARNQAGTTSSFWTNFYSAAGVVNGILTDGQVNVLYNALLEANTARVRL
jgi:hypothetical protein